jgi:flagellin
MKQTGLKDSFNISAAGGTITAEAKKAGSEGAVLTYVEGPTSALSTSDTKTSKAAVAVEASDAYQSGSIVKDEVFSVGGKKFMVATTTAVAAAADAGITVIKSENSTAGNATNTDLKNLAAAIKQQTGYAPTVNQTNLEWKTDTSSGKTGNGLTLQIGDTADTYNQLTVSIGNMSSQGIGISGISVDSQANAQAAIDVIKDAINTVSSTRGDLGAIQNRLEHTSNNLSVMTENIQDAESTIRDTDIAEEMMSYTKNNILLQSAQAMLAQANQVPQGVLQLLQ